MERTLITVPTAIPMVALIGPHDDNLRAVEAAFPSVNITVRGNEITLRGPHIECMALENLFGELMVVIRSGNVLSVDAVARSDTGADGGHRNVCVHGCHRASPDRSRGCARRRGLCRGR